MDRKFRNIYITYPGGKHKALTLSYDDGKIPDRRLVALFNKYGLKATFNVNSGMTERSFNNPYDERIPLSEYKELYKGHEVACHSVTHPTIARCPREQIVQQILEDRRALEEVMGHTIRGFAYPNGSFDDKTVQILQDCGIVHARTVNSTGGFSLPTDYLRWNPTCWHGSPELGRLTDEFINLKKTQYMYLFYVWGHSYEFERDNNWEIIEKFAEKISEKDDIWYASNIDIVDYFDAADRIQISVNGDFAYNPSIKSVWLEIDKKAVEVKGGETVAL